MNRRTQGPADHMSADSRTHARRFWRSRVLERNHLERNELLEALMGNVHVYTAGSRTIAQFGSSQGRVEEELAGATSAGTQKARQRLD